MAAPRPLLSVQGLAKRFGGVVALADISFEIEAGSLHTILGPNGCGKTTLFNLIDGSLKPTAGQIVFDGERIDGEAPHRIARRGIARKFQVPGVFSELSVAQNLEIALARIGGGYSVSALVTARPDRDRRDELAELAGLTDKLGYKVSEIAHGERQRLEIAMLLAGDVRLLLLDEPTAGMSVTETESIAHLARRLSEERKLAVLAVEHDLSFVRALGAPVLVANEGRIIARGDYEEIRKDPRVIQSYLGMAADA
ncbi:ABC transporter ATP-binding protein [Microbaculum sp. FT89]|uniref:ABC transporter ATP-binding protein n=1 Tax=Microbaculum sp. FT89 TaxID=3447298 RepID=UPI003F53888C